MVYKDLSSQSNEIIIFGGNYDDDFSKYGKIFYFDLDDLSKVEHKDSIARKDPLYLPRIKRNDLVLCVALENAYVFDIKTNN